MKGGKAIAHLSRTLNSRSSLAPLSSRSFIRWTTSNDKSQFHRYFSSTPAATLDLSPKAEEQQNERVLVYQGKYSKRMIFLRRFSLFSSLLSVPLMGAAALIESEVIPLIAQIALVGTVAFSSMGSTVMMHFIASPYVITLHEIKSSFSNKDRRFVVTTCNIFGRLKETEFNLSEVAKSKSHPFASFQLLPKGKNFYVFGGGLTDPELRSKLAKETPSN